MAKLTDVTIVDAKTLRLNTDAKQGDEIDLLSLSKVDTSIITAKIKAAQDQEYEKLLNQAKDNFEKDKLLAIKQATETLSKEKNMLEQQLKDLESKVRADLELQFEKERHQLKNSNQEIKSQMEQALIQKELALTKDINQLKIQIQEKNSEIERLQETKSKEIELEVLKKETELQTEINKKDEEISNLRLTKSITNVKKLGEDLENWCNNEYMAYALSGFQNCTWEKDNIAVKEEGEARGTKADYIFKVYANDDFQEVNLLTSVACEMKSEDPSSQNKKKNAEHYAKLDKDRNKKNCEYALLISELEWEQANDVPIRKVMEYEKMYLVRPPYFITFLSIIVSLGVKYQELLLAHNQEVLQFQEIQEIQDAFEKMKSDILDKQLERLDKEIKAINTNANQIANLSQKIIESTDKLATTLLDNIKKKIENFNIKKITKAIDKVSK
ncbi:MAG TPA: DUF2130 domain-containing protein [Bacilli bacterium]|nr:MAG: hypothetical protein BWY97_00699 [Tenericutes bacterium ADurb.BinA124]HPX84154.1 DUF2130 domain-containing protein [Bacilli bacterium]HQC74777.1 DUF2130 domain-containing protein [Bacilli bacterium]